MIKFPSNWTGKLAEMMSLERENESPVWFAHWMFRTAKLLYKLGITY